MVQTPGFEFQPGYWMGQAAGFGPQSGYWMGQKPTVAEPEPKPESKPEPEPKAKKRFGLFSGALSGIDPGLGLGICQLAGCIAILLVVCSCFGGCLTV
jgi:hypothetical protein